MQWSRSVLQPFLTYRTGRMVLNEARGRTPAQTSKVKPEEGLWISPQPKLNRCPTFKPRKHGKMPHKGCPKVSLEALLYPRSLQHFLWHLWEWIFLCITSEIIPTLQPEVLLVLALSILCACIWIDWNCYSNPIRASTSWYFASAGCLCSHWGW